MKTERAAGIDELLPEYFKALAVEERGMKLIKQLLDLCWREKALPAAWKISRVKLIFKKGDPSHCENYRPISLLCIGYKLLAMLLLECLKKAGAEDRLWQSQCGFKSISGTADALFIARRLLDLAWTTRENKLTFLALDWAKAFDSICPEKLEEALYRFGIPPAFIDMISSIYCNREFSCESLR